MNLHMVLKCNVLAGLFALTAGIAFGAEDGNIDLPEGLQGYNMRAYERRVLRPGVTYFKTDFDKKSTGKNLFGQDGPCAIYWLVMEWDKCEGKVSLDIAYNENGQREMPTTWAKQRDAFAWVNGSYHKTSDPSAPIYEVKVRGKEVLHNPYDQSLVWDRAGFGNVLKTANINLDNYEYAISGDGYTAYSTPDFSDTSKEAIDKRQLGRAPRTFAGAIPDRRITIIGAADGRFSGGSIGLECNEERWLLGKWGVDLDHCVNLDGGGSTMCGLKDGDDYVLQSKPSDEKPERRVHHSIELVDVTVGRAYVATGNHGQCSLPEGVSTFPIGTPATIDFQADDGYVIAAVLTNGVQVAESTGAKTYRLEFVPADEIVQVKSSFVRSDVWWINPTVKSDFPVATYAQKNIYDATDVVLDEQGKNVYFGLSTHSYNSASNGVVGFAVSDLLGLNGQGEATPVCGTRALMNHPSVTPSTEYVNSVTVSESLKALIVGRKSNTTEAESIVCPLGKSWGDPAYANYNANEPDARFWLKNDISFMDGTTSVQNDWMFPAVFGPDQTRLYAVCGFNGSGSRYVMIYSVQKDGQGRLTGIVPTGKTLKFTGNCKSLAVANFDGKDIVYFGSDNGSIYMMAPDDFAADANGFVSSSKATLLAVPGVMVHLRVTGVADGEPHLIGTTDKGAVVVFEMQADGRKLTSDSPIVTIDHTAAFGAGMDRFDALDDDTAAIFAYTSTGEGNRKSMRGKVVVGTARSMTAGDMVVEGDPLKYGTPSPGYGRKPAIEWGSTVDCSAPATVEVDGKTAFCVGYVLMTNTVENIGQWLEWKSGKDNAVSYVMPSKVSVRLKWLWDLRSPAGFDNVKTTGGTDASITASAEVTGVGLGEGDSLNVKVVWKAKAYCYTNDVATVTEPGVVSVRVDRMVMPGVTYYVSFLALDKNGNVVVETDPKKTPVPMGTDGNTFVMESEPVEIGSPYPAFGQLITGLPVGATFEGYASYQVKGTPTAVFDHWTLYKKDAQGNWQQASTGKADYHFTYVNDDGKDQKLVFTYNYWDAAGVKDVAVVGGTDASFTASACVSGVGTEKGDLLSVKIAWGLSADRMDHTNDVATATGYGPVSLKVAEDVIPGETYYAKVFALDKNGAVALEEEVVEVVVPMGTVGNTLVIEGNPLAVGTALPAYGTLTGLPSTAAFDCTVTDRIEDATQRKACTGWILYEKDAQGAWQQADQGTTCAYRYDNLGGVDRKLVWQWEVRAIPGLANLVLAGDRNGSFGVTADVTGVGLNDGDKLTVFAAWGLRSGLPSHTNEVGTATSVGTVSATVSGDVYPGDAYCVTVYAVDREGKVAVTLPETTVAIPDDGEDRTPAATATLLEKSDSGVDYNGYEMFYDLSGVNLGRYHADDLRATYTVNGKTYDGEALIEGGVPAGIVFALDATGDNAILAGNAYAGSYRVWFESEERGATETLDEGVNRFVAGAESVENTDWFNETVAAFGSTGEWTLKSGNEPEIEPVGDYFSIESTQDDPLVFTPSSAMKPDTRALIETRFLFTEPSDGDELDVGGSSQCALRVVRTDEDDPMSPCVPQIWAALSDGQGGWEVGWQQANAGDGYSFEVGCEYTVRFEIDYLGDSWGAANTLACFVRKEGATDFVRVFSGYPVNARHGGTAAAGLASAVEFVGAGRIAQLNGSFDVTTIDASVAEVGGTRYATVAAAVAAANGRPVTLLHKASWQPTEDDLDKPVLFADREPLVLDMSVLGEAFVANWTEKGESWELVLTSASPWVDPGKMEGETEQEKTEAAMKALGFDDETAAAAAGAEGGYATLKAWAEARNLKPEALVGQGGVLLSAAIGADEVLTDEDVEVEAIEPNADGSVTLTVTLGDYENLLSGNPALIKAALGVTGAYDLGGGSFSADNVDVAAKTVSDESVELKATPKAVGDVQPTRFFFRATAK